MGEEAEVGFPGNRGFLENEEERDESGFYGGSSCFASLELHRVAVRTFHVADEEARMWEEIYEWFGLKGVLLVGKGDCGGARRVVG